MFFYSPELSMSIISPNNAKVNLMAKKTTQPIDKDNIEKTVVKARYWSFVCYPESAPENWIHTLQMTGLPFCVSPLHDKDIDPTGEPKKAHYHVILCYNGPVTFSNVSKHITEPLGQPHPQYLQSVKGMHRYLTHKDNPDKYQYDEKDILSMNGFSIQDYAELSITDEDRIYDSIEQIIFENEITELYELTTYLKENNLSELKSFVRRHTYYIEKLISSLRHSNYFTKLHYEMDEETGELMPKKAED